jgi:hypothetical protein
MMVMIKSTTEEDPLTFVRHRRFADVETDKHAWRREGNAGIDQVPFLPINANKSRTHANTGPLIDEQRTHEVQAGMLDILDASDNDERTRHVMLHCPFNSRIMVINEGQYSRCPMRSIACVRRHREVSHYKPS